MVAAGLLMVGTAGAAVAPKARGYAVIPLKNVGNAFLVDVVVNQRPMQLILDTGAPLTLLLGEKAKDAGLAWGEARGACEIRSLRCGAAELRGVSAVVASFTGPDAAKAGRRIGAATRDGLVGWDTLRQWGAVIDMAAMRLYLRTASKVTSDLGQKLRASGWTEVPLQQRRGHAFAAGTAGGRRALWVVDTGAAFTTLDRDFATSAGLSLAGRGIRAHTLYKLNNASDSTEIPDLVIGDYHAGPFPVSLLNIDHVLRGGMEGDGLLGFEFLRLNSAVIDCAAARLYLRRPN